MIDAHTIVSTVSAVFMLLIGVIAWFARARVEDMEERLAEITSRLHTLELARAGSEVKMDQLLTAITAIGELRVEISMRYSTREDMAAIHGAIDKLQAEVSAMRERLAYQRALGAGA